MTQKKKILFSYPAMMVGGSTTCLLSILNRLNYDKYEVDLLLNSHTGELLHLIPSSVKLLPPALKYSKIEQEYFHRITSPKYMYHFCKSKWIAKRTGVGIHSAQYLEMKDVEFFRSIDDEYDVAIAALEGDRCKFVAKHIKAKRKLAWIHVNYLDAGFDPSYDIDSMAVFDGIVTVSEECKQSFISAFPELSDRCVVIENILSTEFVQSRGSQHVDFCTDTNYINLVTICRISFASKALDRAVKVLSEICKKRESKLKWYIVGDGPDMAKLRQMISDYHLEDTVILFGMQTNPYPYLKGMSMFFLPSYYEGKPMAVTEAFMMGLPALVTEYSSAREQVRDGIDGIIVDNSEQGIYEGLLRIIDRPELIDELKKNVVSTDYSNVDEMKKVERLIDGEF